MLGPRDFLSLLFIILAQMRSQPVEQKQFLRRLPLLHVFRRLVRRSDKHRPRLPRDTSPKFVVRVFKASTPSPEALRRFTVDTCSESSLAAVFSVDDTHVSCRLCCRGQFRRYSTRDVLSTVVHARINMRNLARPNVTANFAV